MGKLIEADVFDSNLRDAQAECKKNGGNFRFGVLNSVRANLANQPSVDAVPVVRCLDCLFGKRCLDADGNILIQCTNPNYPAAMETWPLDLDWYCAGGKRRDDNGKDA